LETIYSKIAPFVVATGIFAYTFQNRQRQAGKSNPGRTRKNSHQLDQSSYVLEALMSEAHVFVIGILLAWLAGFRVYLTVFGIGVAGLLGWIELPQALHPAQSWWALGASGSLALIEFFTDKIPGVDSISDFIQTLVRIPAGAFLTAAALSPDGTLGTGALLAGAGVSMGSHALKSGTRALLNTSPEPGSNWLASFAEDGLVLAGLALALIHPWLALSLVVSVSIFGALLIWWAWCMLTRGFRKLVICLSRCSCSLRNILPLRRKAVISTSNSSLPKEGNNGHPHVRHTIFSN
jgi:uncharacterized membrane protein